MKRTVISYRVRPETAAVNEELIGRVFDELVQVGPANVSYTAFALEDGVSFLHVVEVDEGDNPIPALASFKRYTEAVLDRCQEQPVVNQAREIGTYRSSGWASSKPSPQPHR